MSDLLRFGARLRVRYTACGFTRVSFAKAIGVAYNTLNRYETGENIPRLDHLYAMAAALETTVLVLLGDEPQPSPSEPEFAAMRALSALDTGARARVMQWANSRWPQ